MTDASLLLPLPSSTSVEFVAISILILNNDEHDSGSKRRLNNGSRRWAVLWLSFRRAVASDTRDPRFESSHPQNFILNTFTANC